MIALATGEPAFQQQGESTILTIPSGDGEPITVSLSRYLLGHLVQQGMTAMVDAFGTPQPDLASVEIMRRGE